MRNKIVLRKQYFNKSMICMYVCVKNKKRRKIEFYSRQGLLCPKSLL